MTPFPFSTTNCGPRWPQMAPQRSKRPELSESTRATIWTLRKAGYSFPKIAKQLDLPYSTVWSTVHTIKQNITNNVSRIFTSQPRSGRPTKLSQRDQRNVCRIALRNRRMLLREFATPSKSGYQLSRHTTRLTLKAGGIIRRKARSKPGLKPYHRKNRRRFAKEQKDRKWDLICWSDEVHFYSNKKSGNVTVLQRIGEEYLLVTTVPTYKVTGFTVSCWGYFMGLERGPFVFF